MTGLDRRFDYQRFALDVICARNAMGFSQQGLARDLGIDRSTIQRIEKLADGGDYIPQRETRVVICDKLGLDWECYWEFDYGS